MMLTQAAAVSGLNALAAAGGGQEGGVEGLLGSVGSGTGAGGGGGYQGLPLSSGQTVPSLPPSLSTSTYSNIHRTETFSSERHPLRVFQPFPGPLHQMQASVGSTLPPASSFPPPPPRYQQQSTPYPSQTEGSSAWGSSLESYENGGIDTFPPRQSSSTSTDSTSNPRGVLFESLVPQSPLDPQSGPAAPVGPPPPPEEVGASLSDYIKTNGRFPAHITIDTDSNQKSSPLHPPPAQSSSTVPPPSTRHSTSSDSTTSSSRKYAAFSGPSPCWWPAAPPSSANPLAIRETEETSPSNDDLQDLLWPGYPPHLPAPGMMERCVETFFNKCPMAPHLLHRGRFISRLSLPPTHENYPHPAILHAVLAVAAFYLGGEIYLIPAQERGLIPNLLERSKRNKNGLSSDRRPVWD